MLGDFINRCLILLLGYAYPGFECYKTVEKNRVDIEELRFWCKYWIIVAIFTVLEKFTDIFIAWLPMYGEMKLVLFVYMWYPKTRGSGYIYETVLRPYFSRHENEIDRKLQECKARAWDYVIFYWQYCTQFGQSAFIQALQHVASQSTRISGKPAPQKNEEQVQSAPPQMTSIQSSLKMKQSSSISKSKKWPPSPPSSPGITTTIHRVTTETPKPQTAHDSQTEYSLEEEEEEGPEPVTNMEEEGHEDKSVRVSVKDRINKARARLRKLDTQNSRTPRSPQRRQS